MNSDTQMLKATPKAWLVWFLAAMFVFYMFMLQASTSVMIPQLMKDFHLSVTEIGVLSASFFYPYLLLQIPAGVIIDRMGIARPLVFSLILCGLATFAFAIATSSLVLEVSRLIMGMASAPAVVCGMCLASRWFPKSMFPMLAGGVEMVGMVGGAVGQYGLAILIRQTNWRVSLIVCAVAAVFLIIAIIIWVKDWPSKQRREQYYLEHRCEDKTAETFWSHCKAMMKKPQVWIACFYGGLMFSLITAFAGLWAVPFFVEKYHLTTATAAGASSLVFIGVALGAPSMGWLACRLGSYRLVMVVMTVVASLLFATVVWCQLPYFILCLAMLLLGLSVAAYALCFGVVKNITHPKAHGLALGFTNMMVILLGAPVLQPLLGWLIDRDAANIHHLTNQDYTQAFEIVLGCLAVSLVLGMFIRERPCD